MRTLMFIIAIGALFYLTKDLIWPNQSEFPVEDVPVTIRQSTNPNPADSESSKTPIWLFWAAGAIGIYIIRRNNTRGSAKIINNVETRAEAKNWLFRFLIAGNEDLTNDPGPDVDGWTHEFRTKDMAGDEIDYYIQQNQPKK